MEKFIKIIDKMIEVESNKIVCNECGHKFKRKIGRNTFEIKCPRRKEYDTEPE